MGCRASIGNMAMRWDPTLGALLWEPRAKLMVASTLLMPGNSSLGFFEHPVDSFQLTPPGIDIYRTNISHLFTGHICCWS